MKPKINITIAALALAAFTGSAPAEQLISNLSEPNDPTPHQPGPGVTFAKSFTTGSGRFVVDSVTLQHFAVAQDYDPLALADFHVYILKPDRTLGSLEMAFVAECGTPQIAGNEQGVLTVTYSLSGGITLEPSTEYVIAASDALSASVTLLPTLIFAASEGFSSNLGASMGQDFVGLDFGGAEFWDERSEAGHLKFAIDGTPVVVANVPPDISAAHASISTLWPPNGKMVPFSVQGVVDPDGDPVAIEITEILQDEPVTTPGEDKSSPDAVVFGANSGNIRAERLGTGNGRVYRVLFAADDGRTGGGVSGEVYITVPHEEGASALDDGPVTGYFKSSVK